MPALWRWKGYPPRGLVHPRTRAGGGARWIQVPAGSGDAGDNESPGRGIPSSGHTTIRKKRVT